MANSASLPDKVEKVDLSKPLAFCDPDISGKHLSDKKLRGLGIGKLCQLVGNPYLHTTQIDQINQVAITQGHIALLDQVFATINERAAQENGATPDQIAEIQKTLTRRILYQDARDSLRKIGFAGTIEDALNESEKTEEQSSEEELRRRQLAEETGFEFLLDPTITELFEEFGIRDKKLTPKQILDRFGITKISEPTAEKLYQKLGITPKQPTPLELLNIVKAANKKLRTGSAYETHARLEKASETRFDLSLPEEQIYALKEAIVEVAEPYGIDEIYRILTLRKIRERLTEETNRPTLLDRLNSEDEVRRLVGNNGNLTVLCKQYNITPLTPTKEELLTALKISIREGDTALHDETTPTGDLYQRLFGRDFDEMVPKFPTPGDPDTKVSLRYEDLSTMTELPKPIATLFRNSDPESLRSKLNTVILAKKDLLPNSPNAHIF